MFDESDIERRLKERGLALLGGVRREVDVEDCYYVLVKVKGDGKKDAVSSRKLKSIANDFKSEGIELILTPVLENRDELTEALSAGLRIAFQEKVTRVFSSYQNDVLDVWLDVKVSKDEKIEIIREKATELLRVLGRGDAVLHISTLVRTPPKTVVLNVLRKNAPVSRTALVSLLRSTGYSIPSDKWLGRVLDNLRRSKLVVRRRDARYVLSLWALKELGSQKNRRSPDIERALALANLDA